eukprot:Gb_26846 [translate_table: standard]
MFATVESTMAYNKLASSTTLGPTRLIAIAMAHGLALFVTVVIATNIFGSHINSAIMFGLTFNSHATFLCSIFYWIAQLLGATIACLLLKFITGNLKTPIHTVALDTSALE